MGFGNARAQRQAQAAAALPAGAGFVHHIKRFGHAVQVVGRDAAAVVLHSQRDRAVFSRRAHLDAPARPGLGGVGEQVEQQVAQKVAVAHHPQPARGPADFGPAVLAQGGRGAAHSPGHGGVQACGGEREGLLVQMQQLEQLAGKVLQPFGFVEDGPGGLALFLGVGLHRAQQVRIAQDAGHRGLELMGERAHEIFSLLHRKLQRGDLFLHGGRHAVKIFAQSADLVAGVHAGAQGIVPGGNAAAGAAEQGQRPRQPVGQNRRHRRGRGQHGGLQQQEALQTARARGEDFGQVKGGIQRQAADQVAAVDAPHPPGRPRDNGLVHAGQRARPTGRKVGVIRLRERRRLSGGPAARQQRAHLARRAAQPGAEFVHGGGVHRLALAQQRQHLAFHGGAGQAVLALLLFARRGQPVGEIAVQQRAAAQRKKRHHDQQHAAHKFCRKTHGDLRDVWANEE